MSSQDDDRDYFADVDFQGSPKSLAGPGKVIDVLLRTWSWAFLPVIFLCGLGVAAFLSTDANEPIRIGAPSKARMERRIARDSVRAAASLSQPDI